MSMDFISRVIGMIVLSLLGVYWGINIAKAANASPDYYAVVLGLVGALVGLVITPFITTRPARVLRSVLGKISAHTLVAGLIGLIVGLIIAALLTFPLSLLPAPFGNIMPFVGVLLLGYYGVVIFVMRQMIYSASWGRAYLENWAKQAKRRQKRTTRLKVGGGRFY